MKATTLARLVLLCATTLCLSNPGRTADWPRFRGPNGDGISHDKDVPVKWSDKDYLFKVDLPGIGHSSPIVSKGRVFVHAATEKGEERVLLCLDALSGKTLWTKTIAAKSHHTHKYNTLASSTPAADGERVCCAFWDGREVILCAFDFTGKELWKYSFGSFESQHGAGCSPMFHENKVYFLHDQDKDKAKNKERASVLACLDASSGKLIWEKTREAVRACYSTPLIQEHGGKKELIMVTTPGITSYSPDDGKINWNFDWKFTGQRLRTVASPLLTNGLVIAVGGDGNGARAIVAVNANGKGSVNSTNPVWESQGKKGYIPYVPSALSKDEYLFCVNDDGFAACLTAKDGKIRWSEQRLGSPVTASPVMIGGKVYAFGEDGKVYVFEAAAAKFDLLAVNDVNGQIALRPQSPTAKSISAPARR